MNTFAKLLLVSALSAIFPLSGTAQVDKLGKTDTIYAEIAKINDLNWSITISFTNDESVLGLTVPLKLSAGLNRIVGDSAIYTGGRVAHFAYKAFRADTAIQCVTLGMVANLGPTNNKLMPGTGRLVTVFVSSADKKAIEKLTVDTTTTNPNNSLMAVADTVQGTPPDTTQIEFANAIIIPAFVIRKPK